MTYADDCKNLEKIHPSVVSAIKEFFPVAKGVTIDRPQEEYFIGNALISRKQIKHIIERRLSEGKSIEKIIQIFSKIPEIIENPDFSRHNKSTKYKGSIFLAKFYKEDIQKGIIVILDKEVEGRRSVITAFTKKYKDYRSLKK